MRPFPDFDDASEPVAASPSPSPVLGRYEPPRQGRNERVSRPSTRANISSYDQQLQDFEAKRQRRLSRRQPPLSPLAEEDDSPYDTYEPFHSSPSAVAEAEVASLVFESREACELSLPTYHTAFRADSANAPSTHCEAVAFDAAAGNSVWADGEHVELGNHRRNESWDLIRRKDMPKGRRIHKFVWVYKVKRNGEIKVRLCVQGCTLESGVDFDQTFSSTLRHCSARALFGHAARCRCSVRSIDFVSAYL